MAAIPVLELAEGSSMPRLGQVDENFYSSTRRSDLHRRSFAV